MEDAKGYNRIKDLCYIRRIQPEVITRTEYIKGEEWILVFDDLKKKLYKFHGNAGAVWKMLNGKNTVDMIINKLSADIPDKRDIVLLDVCKIISNAGKKGLIKAAIKNTI